MNQRYAIDTCAMLVEFNASVWTARKLDRKVSEEVVASKSAGSKAAARVNKNLLAGRNELDVIQAHVTSVRNYVYDNTLPWSDSGLRLLPTIRFAEFNARMQQEEDKYWDLCKSFVSVYPTLITAQAMALGDMFKRDEYPSPDSIAHRFGFNVNYMPVPTAGDFRIDVGNDAQRELQEKLSKLADERVAKAMDDVRRRVKEHLERMADRLGIDVIEGEAKPRRFHDSLVETGFELCDLVKGLNVVNDPDLEHARASLEGVLCSVNPRTKKSGAELSVADTLREDMQQRNAVKAQVDGLLSKFNW
jgi:hypothetical protein